MSGMLSAETGVENRAAAKAIPTEAAARAGVIFVIFDIPFV